MNKENLDENLQNDEQNAQNNAETTLENSEENKILEAKNSENVSEKLSEIEKLQNELNELTDKFYRANADFENIKKRLERDKDSAVAYASEKFAKDLLPIIDALEEAAKIDIEGNEMADKIEDGVKQCVNMFLDTFKKYGILQIATDGKFDPNFHNAIQMIEADDKESGDIIQVYQKGYMFKDRVLRASMVIVAK